MKFLKTVGVCLLFGLGVLGAVYAVGTADASVSQASDNALATFNVVKPIMFTVIGVVIGVGYLKLLKKQ